MPKKDYSEQDGVTRALDLRDIDPSPYQHRKNFDSDNLKQLASRIQRDGLISPTLVRPVGNRFELIAGERLISGHPGPYAYADPSGPNSNC